MSKKVRVSIFTGTRADYGLLKPLIDSLVASHEFEANVVATGTHMSPEFGKTVEEILEDGVNVADRIEMLLSSDSATGIAKAVGLGVVLVSESLRRLNPDIVVILGDRFEALSTAAAAHFMGIPIAHLHGGELTLGSLDDSTRHAITKLSTLHFVSTEVYRRRVIQLGEEPRRVFNVGAIGLDRIDLKKLPTKNSIEKYLGLRLETPIATVTYHPDTLNPSRSGQEFENIVSAVERSEIRSVIVTGANADEGGRAINERARRWAKESKRVVVFHHSLGSKRYLGAVHFSSVVIGNSSSGIIEAPFLGTPTINVGDRQRGRVAGPSVRSVTPQISDITSAIDQFLCGDGKESSDARGNPYYAGGAAPLIMRVLSRLDEFSGSKVFRDAPPVQSASSG